MTQWTKFWSFTGVEGIEKQCSTPSKMRSIFYVWEVLIKMRTSVCGMHGTIASEQIFAPRQHGNSSVWSKQRLTGTEESSSPTTPLNTPLWRGLRFRTDSPLVRGYYPGTQQRQQLAVSALSLLKLEAICSTSANSRKKYGKMLQLSCCLCTIRMNGKRLFCSSQPRTWTRPNYFSSDTFSRWHWLPFGKRGMGEGMEKNQSILQLWLKV